jgi:surface polysaccharide O-acyltransferase-like enzyme
VSDRYLQVSIFEVNLTNYICKAIANTIFFLTPDKRIMEKTNNKYWANNLRVLATISVILLHVAANILYQYTNIPQHIWWIGNIYDGLVRFSVPAFFMLTGALLLPKIEPVNVFLKKRFSRIFPPFLFWSLIYIIYHIWLQTVTGTALETIDIKAFVIDKLLHRSEFIYGLFMRF